MMSNVQRVAHQLVETQFLPGKNLASVLLPDFPYSLRKMYKKCVFSLFVIMLHALGCVVQEGMHTNHVGLLLGETQLFHGNLPHQRERLPPVIRLIQQLCLCGHVPAHVTDSGASVQFMWTDMVVMIV